MTTNEYARALSRAHDARLKVMGKGEWTNGATFYVVTSASEAGRFHLVTLHAGRLSCDCPARALCMHRALVHEQIEAERKPVTPVVTNDRETAMLASRADNRGFSIWASN